MEQDKRAAITRETTSAQIRRHDEAPLANSLFHEMRCSLAHQALFAPQAIEFLNMHKTIFKNRLCNPRGSLNPCHAPRVMSAMNET